MCGDTGWRTIARGKEREVVRCECRTKSRGERLLAAAKIPAHYAECELTNFIVEGDQHVFAAAARTAETFAEKYPVEKTGLLFVGNPGVGKTHLAVGILKKLIRERGISCLFVDYRELLKAIQHTYNASVQVTELDLLKPIFETEIVLIDELGATRTSQWVWDTVAHILNNRYSENRTTILTTNFEDRAERAVEEKEQGQYFTQPEIAQRGETLGDRIGGSMWSRLHEMCKKIDMTGPDFRRHVRSARLVRTRMKVKPRKTETPADGDEA
jgi:DNA replication protein DnaC